jgi:hypothetical protein
MIFIFIEHLGKYYDNMGGTNNMIHIAKDLKLKGLDVTVVIQNFLLNQNVLGDKKFYQGMFKIFEGIKVLECGKILDTNILEYFVSNLNMKPTDTIIATLRQYIIIFENFTKNIIIYVHGGGENHMKHFHPLIRLEDMKYDYPVIFYDKLWLSTTKIRKNINIDDKYLVYPYFTIHESLYPTAIKCNSSNKSDKICYYEQKNKYEFELIHEKLKKNVWWLNENSLEQNIKILNKTKFFFAYDIHSLFVNFGLLLRNNIVIPKYQNLSKSEFMEFYKKDSKRQNDKFFEILDKYLIYIENDDELFNLKYIEFEEATECLFDELINKFHTSKFATYKDLNNDTIMRLGDMINNIDSDKYLRVSMIEK